MDNPHTTDKYIQRQRERSDDLKYMQRFISVQNLIVMGLLLIIIILAIVDTAHALEGKPLQSEGKSIQLDAKYIQCEAYILSVNPSTKDAALAARYLVDASYEAQLGWGWKLLASIAHPESHYDIHSRGNAGERGLLQIHPIHRKNFKPAGLDWDNEYDQVLFGATMLAISERKGYSLHRTLQPWSVRELAIKEYRRIR
jgi:hypothetical protein